MGKDDRMNINIFVEDLEKVTTMMIEDRELNRSAFMRRLINAEYDRRHPETEKAEEACTR